MKCNNVLVNSSSISIRAVEIPKEKPVGDEGAMCSGCGGDYEGDFEDSAEPAFDPGEGNYGAWISDRPPTNATRPVVDAAGSFEVTADPEGNSTPASCAGWTSETAGEIWEILVSATRIVELRVVTADVAGADIDKLPRTKVTAMPIAGQQSRAALSKYYQTRTADPGGGDQRDQVRRSRWLAVDVLSGLKRLLQRARRVFGTIHREFLDEPSRNSEERWTRR